MSSFSLLYIHIESSKVIESGWRMNALRRKYAHSLSLLPSPVSIYFKMPLLPVSDFYQLLNL